MKHVGAWRPSTVWHFAPCRSFEVARCRPVPKAITELRLSSGRSV